MSTSDGFDNGYNTIRRAHTVRGMALAILSFQTLGIIYSDIGTSPLYVLNGIWPASGDVPSTEDIIGGLSAILWSLTLLPLIKYVFISLSFGTDEGEGGTFALYHGLFPPPHTDMETDRTLTGDWEGNSERKSQKSRYFLYAIRWPLFVCSLFGTSLTLADGILTPAVSVTSAVGGIAVAKPSVSSDVVPVSIAFLVALFLIQRFGTAKLSYAFAPITFVWLFLLGATGVANITHYPGIFRAFDPSRAVMLFVRTKQYSLLSGVLLAITGCEALFANLGQFNARSIQIAFGLYVYPCLILAYLGQGARLISDGANVLPNVFYLTIPGPNGGGLYWIIYVFAILATLVASQALITATFSLIQQVVNMKSFPPIPMTYTSETIQGQIYVPLANWTLMILTIVLVAAFGSSVNLTNAYGFAVATVMITTSVLIAFQIVYVKHLPVFVAFVFFVPFVFFDGLFWGASLEKVPHGAWVPLMIGVILCTFMVFWTWGKRMEDAFDSSNRMNLRDFIMVDQDTLQLQMPRPDRRAGPDYVVEDTDIVDDETEQSAVHQAALYYLARVPSEASGDEKGENTLTHRIERRELTRIPNCAVFHKLTHGRGVPHSFIGFIRQYPALPRVVIFLSVRVLPTARVALEDRYQVTKVRTIQGFYGVTYCLGFRDDFEVKVDEVVGHIAKLEQRIDPKGYHATMKTIYQAAQTPTHIVPHYHVVSRPVQAGKLSYALTWARSLLIEGIYRRLATMFPETENWLGSADEIIHVGINAEI